MSKSSCLILTANRILNVRTGKMFSDLGILIQDDKIVNLINLNSSNLPNCEILDLGNITLLPGLIDAHTHLTYHYDRNGQFGVTNPTIQESLNNTADNAEKNILAGFTTIRDLGSPNNIINPIIRKINSGELIGPTIITSEEPIFPHDISDHGNRKNEIRNLVHDRIQKGAKVIKVFLDSDQDGNVPLTLDEMETLVQEAHKNGLKVATHSHDSNAIKIAILGGTDSLEHGTHLNNEDIKLMKSHGTYLVPTLYLPNHYLQNKDHFHFEPAAWQFFEDMKKNGIISASKAIRAGIPIVLGTDNVAGMAGNNGREFKYLIRAGLSPLEAIQSATINAAKLLGISNIAEIRPGYKADIIGIRGNLENPETYNSKNVVFVMKNGDIIKS